MKTPSVTFTVHDKTYSVTKLLAAVATAPVIEVSAASLQCGAVHFTHAAPKSKQLVVFSYEGRYVVLLGEATSTDAESVRVQLISKPALKRCLELSSEALREIEQSYRENPPINPDALRSRTWKASPRYSK